MDSIAFSTECKACKQPFDKKSKQPHLLGCGHTVCGVCVMQKSSCPNCHQNIQCCHVDIDMIEQLEKYEIMKQLQSDHLQKHEKLTQLNADLIQTLKSYQSKYKDSEETDKEAEKKIFCSTQGCLNSFRVEIARICQTCSLDSRASNDARKVFPKTPNIPNLTYWQISQPKIVISSYKNAESNLLCAECVLDGVHSTHQIIRYFDIKKSNELHFSTCEMSEAFGETLTQLLSSALSIDQSLTNNLQTAVENNLTTSTMKAFTHKNEKISSIVEKIKAEREKIKAAIGEYTALIGRLKELSVVTQQ